MNPEDESVSPPETGGTPDRQRLHKNVLVLGVVSALNDMASEVAIRTIPLYLANVLGVKTAMIGLIEGVAESTSTLLKLVAGIVSDRMGRRKPLTLLGFGLSNLMKPLLFFAQSWPTVLALRFLDRVGKGIRTAPRDALLADSVSAEDRGRAFGFNRSMDPIGAIAGLAVAAVLVYFGEGEGTLLTEGTYRTLVLLATVPAFLCILVLALAVAEPSVRRPLQKKFTLRGTLPPGFLRFLAAVFVFNLSATSDAFLVLRAQEIGLPLWVTFALVGLMNVTLAFVSFPSGVLSDRLGRRRFLAAGWVIFGLMLLGFAYATTAVHLAGLFVLYGLYLGLTEGVEKALLTDLAPEESRGTAFGYFQVVVGVAALPASLITGILWQWFGSHTAFVAGAVLAVLGAVLLAFVPTVPRQDSQIAAPTATTNG